MEAKFDNKTNVLNAKIRTTHDDTVIYSVTTSEGLWGRRYTFLKDANPALGDSTTVGVIHWNEKIFEVCGHKKSLTDIRRKPQGFRNKSVAPFLIRARLTSP